MAVKDNGQVMEYINNHPFGETAQSWASYDEPMKFTGHERDTFLAVGYDYFGARYYDPELGQFTSIDKAAQFASGFVYGNNNPIIGVDKDGNFFWVAFIMGAIAGGYGGAQIAAADDADLFESIFYTTFGAAIGGFSGITGASIAHSTSGVLGLATGSLANSAGMNALSGGELPVQMNLALGTLDLSKGGFRWNNFSGDFLQGVGTVMGALTVAEDLNRAYSNAFGKTPEDVTNEGISEEQVTAAKEAADRNFYEPFEGTKTDVATGQKAESVPEFHAKNNIRVGRTHYDIFKAGEDPQGQRIIIHIDDFAGGFGNPGSCIQHAVFEAGPFDMLKKIGISIQPGSWAAQPFYVPGAFYRQFPSINYNRKQGVY